MTSIFRSYCEIYLSVSLSVWSYRRSSVRPYRRPSVRLSDWSSIRPSVCLTGRLSVRSSVRPFVIPFVRSFEYVRLAAHSSSDKKSLVIVQYMPLCTFCRPFVHPLVRPSFVRAIVRIVGFRIGTLRHHDVIFCEVFPWYDLAKSYAKSRPSRFRSGLITN